MNKTFLNDTIQSHYLRYLEKSKKISFNNYIPYFVKLHNDYEWYYNTFQKHISKTLNNIDIIENEIYELPFILFIYVSNADNIIELDEYESFLFILKKFAKINMYKNFINNSININNFHFKDVEKIDISESELRNKLLHINFIIKEKYDLDKEIKILYFISILSEYLAKSNGDFFKLNKINEYELKILKDIYKIFNLDILDLINFKSIGDKDIYDIFLPQKNKFYNIHIYLKIYKESIIIIVKNYNGIDKLNNNILEKDIPYIIKKSDILFLGTYVITYDELLYLLNHHTIEHVYKIEDNKLLRGYKYLLNYKNIVINDDLNNIYKFNYFDEIKIENYLIYCGTFNKYLNKTFFDFNENIIYLFVKNNNIIMSNKEHSNIIITKYKDYFRINSSIKLFYKGRYLDSSSILNENEIFYYSNIRFTITSNGIQFKKLKSYDIEIESLKVCYKNNIILQDINLEVKSSDMICIMGPSGCGKTTFLDSISYPHSIKKAEKKGLITYNGQSFYENYKDFGKTIGFVSQDDVLFSNLTVFENLKYYMLINGLIYDRHLIEDTLDDIGLLSKKDLKVGNKKDRILSGGQRKRLNIALEFVKSPKIIFLDEPTSGLSSKDSESIINLLRKFSNKGITTISVLHQPSNTIFDKFDKFLFLMQGYVAYYGGTEEAYTYFSTFDEYNNNQHSPDLFFDIAEALEIDENGFEVKLLLDGHLHETKHKYSGLELNKKFIEYKKDLFNV